MERIDYYKYHKSDFRLLIDIDTKYKGEDDSIVALTTVDRFVFKFWTKDREKPYICSSTGGETPVLKNCSILDEHRVMCNFDMAETDNQQLEPGRLMLEAEFILPDTDFEGDKHNNVKRYYTTSLILTADPDKDSEGDHTLIPLLIDCLRGETGKSAYQYAVEHGYEGTEEAFGEAQAVIPELAVMAAGKIATFEGKVANFEGLISGTSPILAFDEEVEYGKGEGQVRYCYHGGLLYRATATHTGEWNDEYFEAINMIDLLETYENMVVGDKTVSEFDPEKEYTAGDPVIYNNEFYIFKRGHTGEWDETDVDKTSFIEWLKNLSDTIETYVGNGKEQVVVSCSTEAQGVSMAGLTLMVYLNGSTTEAEEYTTDSHGMATFRIPVGYTYRIVYPSVAGVVTPAPETHTASVGQRSVEVRYDVPPAPQVEVLAVNFQKWGENTGGYTPYQGQARITIGGTATTYTADEDGVITVNIPLGTAYTLDIIKPEGLHIMGGSYHKSLVAEQSSRVEVVRLSEYLSGILLTDEEGNDYTFDQFQSLVEQGVLAKGDAKYIHLCTDALLQHAVVEGTDSTCYVSIYEIGKRKYHDTDGNFANMQWCNNNIQFSSIPNNVYQYDGKYRTAQIVAEGIERGYATPAATRLSGMSYTFTNSSATVITGFLASRGQWDALWNNRTYIDEMLDYVFDGAEHLTLSSFTTNKWASDQVGIGAFSLIVTWYNPSKLNQSMAVPFYA